MVGVVLTGGASTRMGRTKAAIEIDGVPMARRVADAMSAAGCAPVVAFGGDVTELAPLGLAVVHDPRQGEGPLAALLGVLEYVGANASRGATWVLVAACDLPGLTGDDLRPMIAAASDDARIDVVAARTDRIEPACAVWRVSAAPQIRTMYERGARALHTAIERLGSDMVDLAPRAMANMNTPDDLPGYS